MKANPEVALVAAIWLLVETAVFIGLATVLALVVAGVRTYYGPWADPPGSDEVWYLLLAVAIGLAVWRFLRRWRGPDEQARVARPPLWGQEDLQDPRDTMVR